MRVHPFDNQTTSSTSVPRESQRSYLRIVIVLMLASTVLSLFDLYLLVSGLE